MAPRAVASPWCASTAGTSTVEAISTRSKDWSALPRLAEEPLQGVPGGQRVRPDVLEEGQQAALAAKKKGGPSKRELLKQKMMEEQAAMDKKKGGSSVADLAGGRTAPAPAKTTRSGGRMDRDAPCPPLF